jgi:ATP-dependent RNA helicase RhlE
MVPSDYLHRIGRTGRAGIEGDAISLVCVDEAPMLRDIERLLGGPVPTEIIPGFEPDRSIRPEPIRLRTAGGGARRDHGPRRQQPAAKPRAASRWDGRSHRQQRRPVGASIGNRGGEWTRLPGERGSR